MPVNKDALSRYYAIDDALRNRQHPYPTIEELIALIQNKAEQTVATRTVEKDIEDMRHNSELKYYAPIKYHKTHKGYYYDDPDYSISGIPISKADLEKLKYAISILSQFEGIPYLAELYEPIEQLNRMMHLGKSTGQWLKPTVLQIETPNQWPDTHTFETVLDAIIHKNEMEICYQVFGKKVSNLFKVHPYLLKEYKNRWYMAALSTDLHEIRIYGIDRITQVKTLNSHYTETFDSESYFRYALGITVQNHVKPSDIVLHFSPDHAPYIMTSRIHHTQKVIRNDKKGLRIGLTLYPSYELTMLIRSYGSGVKVVKPKWLREEILEDAEKVTGK